MNQGYTNCDDELQYKHLKESRYNKFPGVVKLPYRATIIVFFSNVATKGLASPPTIGLWTKLQNKENTAFLALLRLLFLHWNGLKSDLKHLLKHVSGRGG